MAWIRSPRPPLSASDALQVGNNDDPLPEVWGAGMHSTHHERPCGVAERFQARENPVDSSSAEARNVLKCDPTGSKFADEPDGVEEQAGSFAIDPAPACVGGAGVLAGRGTGHKVNWSMIGKHLFSGEGLNVGIDRHAVARLIDRAAPRIGLAPGHDLDARPR
jgi:hypothetical protein